MPFLDRFRRRGPTDPSFLSSKGSFPAAVGSLIEPGRLGGYYIDFSFKASTARWPPPGRLGFAEDFHVWTAQWGLGALERHLKGEGEQWLQAAQLAAEELLADQGEDGTWPHLSPMPHTYRLAPPWLSAMAQGEAASLLMRLHSLTGDERYVEGAVRALRVFALPVADGGVRASLGEGPFFEEYPTRPASLVLNGGIFALWGAYDVAIGLGDTTAWDHFEAGVDALASNIDRYDTGYWSLYDLYPHPLPNVASSAYHALHIDQLEAMQLIAPRPQFARALLRFRNYEKNRASAARAFGAKVAFRLAVPRNSVFAHRTPWSR